MTPSDTSKLAAALAARRPEADPETGEIVDLPVAETSTAVVPATEAPPPPPDYSRVPAKVVGALPYASTYMRLARTIHGTELVPRALRGRADAVMAAMMMGYELGLGPMQSLNGIQVIDGKAGLSAELMRALVQQSGHLFILSQTDEAAEVKCRRRDWPEGEFAYFRWTLKDAQRAGLLRQASGWSKYPRAMLAARVTSEACRATFADVLAGMSYTPEELEDIAYDDRPPASDAAPAPKARRRSKSAPEPTNTDTESVSDEVPAAPVEAAETVDEEPTPEQSPAEAFAAEAERRAEAARAPSAPGAHGEMVKALNEVIRSLPKPQQPLVRAYLARQGMGDLSSLSTEQLQAAINIAAGWPTSVATPDDEAIDAEVVDEEELPF